MGQNATSRCSDAAILRIEGAFNSKNLSQARSLATPLLSCPEPYRSQAHEWLKRIEIRETNSKRKMSAMVALRRNNLEEACQSLLEIQRTEPDYPSLAQDLAQIPGCSEEYQRRKSEFERARDSISRGRYTEALKVLKVIQREAPDFPGLEDEIKNAEEARAAEFDRQLERDYAQAAADIEEQNWEVARDRLTSVAHRRPHYKETDNYLARAKEELQKLARAKADSKVDARPAKASNPSPQPRTDQALADFPQDRVTVFTQESESGKRPATLEKVPQFAEAEHTALRAAMVSFYRGDYGEARELLESALAKGLSEDAQPIAHFYLAAAAAAAYLSVDQGDPALLKEARNQFETIRNRYAGFTPLWKGISPKIRRLFENRRLTGE